jgi:hypothetical protein
LLFGSSTDSLRGQYPPRRSGGKPTNEISSIFKRNLHIEPDTRTPHDCRIINQRGTQFSLTCMELIPNEILKHILSFVEKRGSDRLNAHLTCKLWTEIAGEVFDPSEEHNAAFRRACEHGRIDCVRRLLRHPK